jgi:hypothetical protein
MAKLLWNKVFQSSNSMWWVQSLWLFFNRKLSWRSLFSTPESEGSVSDTPTMIEKQRHTNHLQLPMRNIPKSKYLTWTSNSSTVLTIFRLWYLQFMLNWLYFYSTEKIDVSFFALTIYQTMDFLWRSVQASTKLQKSGGKEEQHRKRCYLTFEQCIPPLAQYLLQHGSQHVIDKHLQSWLKAQPCKRALSSHPAEWFEGHTNIEVSTVQKKV